METSVFYSEKNRMMTRQGYYSCELELQMGPEISLASVASLTFNNVQTNCFCDDGKRVGVDELVCFFPLFHFGEIS